MLEEGTQAPPFELEDQEGNLVSLDEYRGKWVALWWYVKASTPG
jgi:peroxiredoxin Q/BCP